MLLLQKTNIAAATATAPSSSSSSSSFSVTTASRLKRVVLIGDHHQLPPVVKHAAFQRHAHLDQSLFARFVRLGVPHVLLDKQGRARPEIAALYSWRYTGTGTGTGQGLGNLPAVEANGTGELPPSGSATTTTTITTSSSEAMVVDDAATTSASTSASVGASIGGLDVDVRYQRANAGFVHTFQFVDVGDFQGRGESQPTPYFYQVTTHHVTLRHGTSCHGPDAVLLGTGCCLFIDLID